MSMTEATKDEAKPAAGVTLEGLLKEISLATDREKDYRKDAVDVIKIYEGIKHKTEQYNILYSNIDTMQPALYNSTPRPVVTKRFKADGDVLAKASSNLMQRLLAFMVQDENPTHSTFDELMNDSVLGALLVSRGLTRFKYDAELVDEPQEKIAGEEEGAAPQETEALDSPPQRIAYECVYGEQVPWNNVLYGYAKYWKDVPWISFIHLMTSAEFKENFPNSTLDMDKLKSSYGSDSSTSDKSAGDAGSPDGTGAVEAKEVRGVTLIPVYELWHKASKKVYFLSEFCDDWLKPAVDDPFDLRGFYPCPRPLNLMQRLSSLVPTLMYTMYKEQSEELNRITLRIQKLVVALKIRGAYDSTVPQLEEILKADDNTMVALQDAAVLYAQNGSIDRAIWLMPIKDLVGVLQQLYTQRTQIKQIIFEITGLADIMRGSTQASETLGAQEIKNQWGTLRLKRSQKLVQRYVRDCLRIMGELAVTKLQPDRIKAMTQSDLPSAQDKQIAQLQLQQAQQTGQQPDPKLLATTQMPSFEEALQVLQDDLTRSYKIDIETNSTIDAEATEDKQEITEALTALGQALNAIGPLVQSGTLPFEAAKAIMLAVCRKFKFGTEIEDQINLMQAPKQPEEEAKPAGPSPEQLQAESQVAMAKAQAELRKIQMESEANAQEHQMKMIEMNRKAELDAAKHQRSMQELAVKASMPPPAPAPRANPAKKGN
jgi:hypothetical protein